MPADCKRYDCSVLVARGFQTVLDTNISPYPTSKESEWRQLSATEKALWVFPEVVARFRPALVLLHGNSAYEQFTDLYAPALRQPVLFSEDRRQTAALRSGFMTILVAFISKSLGCANSICPTAETNPPIV